MLWRLALLLCLNTFCVKCACINIFLNTNRNDRGELSGEQYHFELNPQFYLLNINRDLEENEENPTSEMPTLRQPEIYSTHLNIPTSRRQHHSVVRTTPHTTRRPLQMENTNEKFNTKLYQIMASHHQIDSLVYSPISVQSIMAILYLGAEFNTAKQLQIGLELPNSREDLLHQFQAIMWESQKSSQNFQLNFVQKIYFKDEIVLRYSIRDTAINYFNSEITPISFNPASIAAEEINQWINTKTHNRISKIIEPDSLDDSTNVVLINAIYLKARWLKEFSRSDTLKQEFFVGNQAQPLSIDMMYVEDDFKYGEFPELNAKIVELPFLDTELSMLIILPNERDGLAATERLLRKNSNLNQFLGKMKSAAVTLRLPKFKIESDLDMESPLKELGINDIFTEDAHLGKMFSNPNVRISKIQHKAFINVNEGGVEAAASTFVQLVPLSLEPNMIYFTADHPFMFVIRSPLAVYFIGHVYNNFQ